MRENPPTRGELDAGNQTPGGAALLSPGGKARGNEEHKGFQQDVEVLHAGSGVQRGESSLGPRVTPVTG